MEGQGTGPGEVKSRDPEERRTLFNGGVLSALGHRDYAILWSSDLLSNLGTWVQTAVLLWLIKNVLHSNSWVGAVNLASFVPVIFLVPFTGALSDRYDRKRMLILSQVIMFFGALALGIAASLNSANKAAILVTVAVIGVGGAISFPAWIALLPDMVPPEDVLNAIALSSAQWNVARLIGPLIAAAVLALSTPAVAFYVNAASFLVVIGALFLIHPRRGALATSTESLWRNVLGGFRYAWEQRWITGLLLTLTVVAFFGMSYIPLLPGFVQDTLHRGSSAYGVLLGMTGLGAITGSLLVSYVVRFYRIPSIIRAGFLSLGLLLIGFAAFRQFWLLSLIVFGLGVSFIVAGTAASSMLLNGSVREMRGRVSSLFAIVYVGVSAIGGYFLSYVADVRTVPFSLALGGTACIAVTIVLVFFPGLVGGPGECAPGNETCTQMIR